MMHASEEYYKNLALELNWMWFRVEQSLGLWRMGEQWTIRIEWMRLFWRFRWVRMKRLKHCSRNAWLKTHFALMQ